MIDPLMNHHIDRGQRLDQKNRQGFGLGRGVQKILNRWTAALAIQSFAETPTLVCDEVQAESDFTKSARFGSIAALAPRNNRREIGIEKVS